MVSDDGHGTTGYTGWNGESRAMPNNQDGGWSRWQEFVLAEIRRVGESVQAGNARIESLTIEVALIKASAEDKARRAGVVWGIASGVIGAAATAVLTHLFGS